MHVTPQSVLPASAWAATACKAPLYHPVSRSGVTDVAIVGAGYTGLSTAIHLARSGVDTTVVEASEPGWGASGRNGGQIIAGLKFDPDRLEAMFGPRLGAAMVATMGDGADLVASLIANYKIDCHPIYSGWIQAAHGPKAYQEIVLPRATQWAARGVAAKLLDRQEIAAMIGSPRGLYVGGWHDPRGGVLQPLSYARGLATAAMSEGATIHAYSPVRRLGRAGDRWLLDLGSHTITANKVVLATNAYTDDLWPGLRQTVVPVTSFQIATYPLDKAVRESIIPGGQGATDTRRLLLYFRLDHEGRLIMGGRCPVDDNPTLEQASALRATIAKTFPRAAAAPIQFLWSGKVALTKDSLPHIHLLAPNLYAALGCNGRGVAACTTLGKVMAQFVGGAAVEDLPLPVSVPDRFALHAFRKMGVLFASQYYRLLDQLEARS
ncbi:MAG TPA: FAD-dependent oxidoreductase [Dongiaceae bacterium]|nr:FAD-dependent oxidoreductase [Dongiaceae bacterium]